MIRGRKLLWSAIICVLAAVATASGQVSAQDGEWDFYFGYIHSHTSYSDGELTPEEAYAYARDVAGLDFLGITEHGYYMVENPHHWEALVEAAKSFTEPGRFVAFRGTEWTHGAGHISIIEAPEPCSRDVQVTFDDLIGWMSENKGIASFNHPQRNEQGNWDDFKYSLEGNKTIRLLEVGSGPYPGNTKYEASYVRALDRGWHLGAINSQDNHRADWGTATDARTGVVARALTREDLMEALRAMRTYSTEDKNVRVRFAAEGQWMGSTLPLGPAEFVIDVSDPDPGDAVEKAEVVSNRGTVIATLPGSGDEGSSGVPFHRTLRITPKDGYNWYYLRIEQKDKDVVVTSPIWIKSRSDLLMADFRFDVPLAKKGATGHLRGDVVNLGAGPAPGTIVEFAAVADGQRMPIGAVKTDVGPGATVPVSLEWACPVSGDVTVVATVIDPSMPAYSENAYSIELHVLPEALPRVVVDEGHNNRASGFAGSFLDALASNGYEGVLCQGRITPESLRGTSILIIANPEPGIALTPTTFDESELAAVREFVTSGGSLVLAGSSDAEDPERDVDQLNAILTALGCSMRFSDDEVREKGEGSAFGSTATCILTADGERLLGPVSLPVRMSQGCSIADDAFGTLNASDGVVVLAVGADEACSVDTNGKGSWHAYTSRPVVCASEDVGKGRVVAMGAPLYSAYDFRPDLGNEEFMLKLVGWLGSR